MKKFIIVSTDGYTEDNLGNEVENAQILSFVDAENKEDALRKYLDSLKEDYAEYNSIGEEDNTEDNGYDACFSEESMTVYEIV